MKSTAGSLLKCYKYQNKPVGSWFGCSGIYTADISGRTAPCYYSSLLVSPHELLITVKMKYQLFSKFSSVSAIKYIFIVHYFDC